ncbi:MAG: hypothetical protein ABIN54_07245 [candidate division WOR-3 bacterium]
MNREGQAKHISATLSGVFGAEPESVWQGPEEGWLYRPRFLAKKVKDMVYIGLPSARGQVFDLWDCPHLPREQRALLERIKRFFKEEGVSFYDKRIGRGKISGIGFCGSPDPKSLVVSLITRLPVRSRLLGEKISRLSGDITGVCEECEGKVWSLSGEHHYFHRIGRAIYRMTPGGVWPENPFLHEAIIRTIKEMVRPGARIAEAGVGYFLGLALAEKAKSVIVFDTKPDLLADTLASSEASYAWNITITLDNLLDVDKGLADVFLINAERGPVFAESARSLRVAEQVIVFGKDIKSLYRSHKNLTSAGFKLRRLLGFEPSPNRAEAFGLAEYGR